MKAYDWVGVAGVGSIAWGLNLIHAALPFLFVGAACLLFAYTRGRQSRGG